MKPYLEQRNQRIRNRYKAYRRSKMSQEQAITLLVREFSAYELKHETILKIVSDSNYGVLKLYAVRYQQEKESEFQYLRDEQKNIFTATSKNQFKQALKRLRIEMKVFKMEVVEYNEKQ